MMEGFAQDQQIFVFAYSQLSRKRVLSGIGKSVR